MLKIRRISRFTLTVGLACLQLSLLPASQLLHVGCHSADCEPHADGADHSHQEHTHCCHHSTQETPSSPDDKDPGLPARHDSHDCGICQVILAAKIGELDEIQVPTSDLIVIAPTASIPEVHTAPRYVLPSRGPPA